MADLTQTALELIRLYGPLALAVFTFLETSLLFPFLPSEIVVPAAAAVIVTGVPSLLGFVAAATVGGTVGAFVPYVVFRGPGLRGAGLLCDLLAISDDTADRARTWFERWGQSSVLWGRFLPGLRSAVSIPAGLAEMGPGRFGVYTAVGSVGFYGAVGILVLYGRRQSLFEAVLTVAGANPWATAAISVAVLVFSTAVWWFYRRRD